MSRKWHEGPQAQGGLPKPTLGPAEMRAAVEEHKRRRLEARARRVPLLDAISRQRGAALISYVTCARGLGTKIGPDVIRNFRDHLGNIGKGKNLDLVLITRGGDTLVPLRLMSLLREFAERVSVLVPFMAHSAGTLIALGADEIMMGTMAELGPVDPTVANPFNPLTPKEDLPAETPKPHPRIPISVEDVTAYLDLVIKRAQLDKAGLAQAVQRLSETVHPLALGNIVRNHNLIRHLARRLLLMHMDEKDEKLDSIVETLTEKLYAHNYLIAREEARSIGLKVTKPSDELDAALWRLYLEYEAYLHIRSDIDLDQFLGDANAKPLISDSAIVESKAMLDSFCYKGIAERKKPGEFHFQAMAQDWESEVVGA